MAAEVRAHPAEPILSVWVSVVLFSGRSRQVGSFWLKVLTWQGPSPRGARGGSLVLAAFGAKALSWPVATVMGLLTVLTDRSARLTSVCWVEVLLARTTRVLSVEKQSGPA